MPVEEKREEYICDSCDSEYAVVFKEANVDPPKPVWCPFCGVPLIQEELVNEDFGWGDDEETEDDSDDEHSEEE